MKQVIAQQGEVRIVRIDRIPANISTRALVRDKNGFIISHSESGHHHLLADGEVMERTERVPAGMQIIYAIVKEPTRFFQDAPTPHEAISLDPGVYEFRLSREFDPFAEQARRVAD